VTDELEILGVGHARYEHVDLAHRLGERIIGGPRTIIACSDRKALQQKYQGHEHSFDAPADDVFDAQRLHLVDLSI